MWLFPIFFLLGSSVIGNYVFKEESKVPPLAVIPRSGLWSYVMQVPLQDKWDEKVSSLSGVRNGNLISRFLDT